ncbi:MAG: SDR family oxidoreductase [Actinomycetota bacterium]|nr:SDR family oxidoreductase [Actinomycetota bacterium]
MNGKVVVITGGNSGIGKETAVGLAQRGARVVIAVRNQAKGAAALAEIRARSGSDTVEMASLDLASFASVRACAQSLLAAHDRIDVLVNNAGIITRKRAVTDDGHETQFQVNHLSHFLFTALLRDQIVKSAPARIVNVASGAHNSARKGLDFDDLESERRYQMAGFGPYGRTKLMNILFTRELARGLDGTGVTANALHPGFVSSNFGREGDTGPLGNIAMVLGRPFALTPAKGAQTSIYLASSPEVEGVSGQYFYKSALAKESASAQDDEAAARLWQISELLTTP